MRSRAWGDEGELTSWSLAANMEQWCGKAAFVTGASAGIGYDLSKQLCELGMNVVGCARNTAKIEVSVYLNSLERSLGHVHHRNIELTPCLIADATPLYEWTTPTLHAP